MISYATTPERSDDGDGEFRDDGWGDDQHLAARPPGKRRWRRQTGCAVACALADRQQTHHRHDNAAAIYGDQLRIAGVVGWRSDFAPGNGIRFDDQLHGDIPGVLSTDNGGGARSGRHGDTVAGRILLVGTNVTIEASPKSGYKFKNCTGNVANSTSATTTVTMAAPETVTGNFAKK